MGIKASETPVTAKELIEVMTSERRNDVSADNLHKQIESTARANILTAEKENRLYGHEGYILINQFEGKFSECTTFSQGKAIVAEYIALGRQRIADPVSQVRYFNRLNAIIDSFAEKGGQYIFAREYNIEFINQTSKPIRELLSAA